jgi:hypothetical protein
MGIRRRAQRVLRRAAIPFWNALCGGRHVRLPLPFNICASCVYFPLLVGVWCAFVNLSSVCSFLSDGLSFLQIPLHAEEALDFQGILLERTWPWSWLRGFGVYCYRLSFVSFFAFCFSTAVMLSTGPLDRKWCRSDKVDCQGGIPRIAWLPRVYDMQGLHFPSLGRASRPVKSICFFNSSTLQCCRVIDQNHWHQLVWITAWYIL